MNRDTRSTSPRRLPARSPDITYDATTTAASKTAARTEAARTMPLAVPRHLVQAKPGCGAYPSLQTAQSAAKRSSSSRSSVGIGS